MSPFILVYAGLLLLLVAGLLIRTMAAAGPPSDTRPPAPGRMFVLAVSGLMLLIGVWLVVSPWVYDFTGNTGATWNWIVSGTLIALIAAGRAVWPVRSAWITWAGAPLGAWVICSPYFFALTDNQPAFWTALVLGAITIALSVWNALAGGAMIARRSPAVRE
jgi:hypothetical protein